MKRLILGVLFVLEAAGVAYAAVMSWLLSVWFLDDHVASQMTDVDWWVVAGERVALCVVGAGGVAAITYLATRFVIRHAGITRERVAFVNAAIVFAVIVLASLAGALQFAITKPYI